MLSSLFAFAPVARVHTHLERAVSASSFDRTAEHAGVEEITPPKPKHGAEKPSPSHGLVARERLDGRIENQVATLPVCWRGEGPSGPGVAEVTYTPAGLAFVKLAPPYADTPVGSCVKHHLALAAEPFDGSATTVTITFTL